MTFENKIALLTGAAGNLGSAAAAKFIHAGAKLVLLDHAQGRLERLYPELTKSEDALLLSSVDLTNEGSVRMAVEMATNRFGRIDILVNTVGGYRAGKPLHETPISTWELMMNLNARTAFLICQAVIPIMLKHGYGKIVNVSARPGLEGKAKMAAYSASKSAVLRLSESLSQELKYDGINVNCILPGTIDTPDNRATMPNADHTRWVAPDAIASVIQFLCSDDAEAIQGAAIPVAGKS